MIDIESMIWIQNQFKGVSLPDLRLTKRLEQIACRMMAKPGLSIPKQNKRWKNIKAAYRFYDSDKVQFSKLIAPHTEKTKKNASKMNQLLAVQDTCFISYTHHPSVKGLTNIGGEKEGKGIILHSTLAVDPNQKHSNVIGLLDQYIHHRTKKVDKNETYQKIQSRWRESKIWEEASQRIDIKNSKAQIVEVMDREGDVFDIIKNCLSLKHDFVIRAKNNRLLEKSDEKLFTFAQNLKTSGTIKLKIRTRPNQTRREAILDVAYSAITIRGPKNRKKEVISCNVVYVAEKKKPKDQKHLEWILLTSVNVNSFEDACQIIEWYKCRWIIEEYHKAIKSGCKIEEKQLKNRQRLENFLGIAGIIALRIMKLRDFARSIPEISAKKVIDPIKVDILMKYNDIKKEDITIHEYYREVAIIGGFIGRKSDGEPGWQTLWRGETELTLLVMGAKMALERNNCG